MTCFTIVSCLLPKCCISDCCRPETQQASAQQPSTQQRIQATPAVQSAIASPTQHQRAPSNSSTGPSRVVQIHPRNNTQIQTLMTEDPSYRPPTPRGMNAAQNAHIAQIQQQIGTHHKQASSAVSIGTFLRETEKDDQ